MCNPDKSPGALRKFCRPGREKFFHHENTKGRKHEKDRESIRIFMILYSVFETFEHLIFGFRIYHTMNVVNINPYRVEPVPGPLDPRIFLSQ